MKDSQGKMVKMPKKMIKDFRDPIDHPERYDKPLPEKLKKWIEEETKSGLTYQSNIDIWKRSL
jgi:hypothetical protein